MNTGLIKPEDKRLLFVAHGAGLYGAEKSLLAVVVGLKVRGWNLDAIVPSIGGFSKVLDEQKIPYLVKLIRPGSVVNLVYSEFHLESYSTLSLCAH